MAVDLQLVVVGVFVVVVAALAVSRRGRAFLARLMGDWMKAPRRSWSPRVHELPHIPTRAGVMVRSEPERAIAEWLFARGIRFNYEQPVGVRNWKGRESWRSADFFLPDYAVYWEHFGLWNDPEYQRKAKRKLGMYREAGYRLIVTFGGVPTELEMARKLGEFAPELRC